MSRFVFRLRKREREFSAELQSHLDMHIADNVSAGMTQEEARRRALVALGGMEQTRERYREATTFRWIDALLKDMQFGFRTMRRSAGFTTLAIVTLSVGIAATNTAFTIMNAVLIRELPFDEAERLVDDWPRRSLRMVTTEPVVCGFHGLGASRTIVRRHAASQTGTMNVSDDEPRSRAVPRQLRERIDLQASPRKPVLGRDLTPRGRSCQARRRSPF